MVQRIRPIASGLIVGVLTFAFLMLWMHAPLFFGVLIAAILGVLVLAISGSGPSPRDEAADAAWLAAAPDLPPHSERRAMERQQDSIAAPAGRSSQPPTARAGATVATAEPDASPGDTTRREES